MNKIYRKISLHLHLKLSTVLRVLCNMTSLNGINNLGGINSINFILQIRNLSFRKYKLLAQGLTVNDQSPFLLKEPPVGYWLTSSFLFLLIYQFRMGPQSSDLLSPADKGLCWTSPEIYTFERLYFLCEGMSCVQKNRSDLILFQYCQPEKLTHCWQVLWFF